MKNADIQARIRTSVANSIECKKQILSDAKLIGELEKAVHLVVDMYKSGGCFFAAGNGGSSSDAQHIVSEFVGRFNYDRDPLRAQELSSNTSNLTLIANDYGYDQLFARQIWAAGRKGDVFLAISTSGNSKNLVLAVEKAKELGMKTIALVGGAGGKLSEICDLVLRAPSTETARIQEAHIMLGHVLCEGVEAEIFPRPEARV
jgi:D-sedoheptulose 7-phosphate isomerase